MTKNQQIILSKCDEFEPLETADGGFCLDGEHKGKTISYGTCQSCLASQGINIVLEKVNINKPKGTCTTCRGLS